MSEQLSQPNPEVVLYPGVISETIDRALGFQALISLEEIGGE